MPIQVRAMVAVFLLMFFMTGMATSQPASACRPSSSCTIEPQGPVVELVPEVQVQHRVSIKDKPEPTSTPITAMQLGVIGALARTIILLRRRRASIWILGITVSGFFALLGYIWTLA